MNRPAIIKSYFLFSLAILWVVISITDVNAFFNSRKRIFLPTRAQTIAIGDINNDGSPDLVIGRWPETGGGTISILLGRGNGEFRRETTISYAPGAPYTSDIKLGYFNKDKNLDIAIAHNNSTEPHPFDNYFLVSVLMGNGSGRFGQEQDFILGGPGNESFAAYELLPGDYDLDGNTDLYLVAGIGGSIGGIFSFRNTGNGALQPTGAQYMGLTPYAIAAGDFNSDSKPDVVLASSRGSLTCYGAGNMSFNSFESHDSNRLQEFVAIGDFNSDGRKDYAVTDTVRGEVRVFFNNPSGFSPLPRDYATKAGIDSRLKSLITADFNNDGNLDLAFSLYSSGQINFLYGNGNGSFFRAGYIQTGNFTREIAAADFNGDGLVDLAAVNDEDSPSEQVDVFMNSPDAAPKMALCANCVPTFQSGN